MLESVSERKAGRLAELGVETVLDLLTTYPRRYIDRTRQADVSDLQVGEEAAVLATVQSASARRARTGRAVVDVVVRDGTGRLKIVFFNQPWRAKQLEAGTEAIFFGKVTEYQGARQLTNPVVDVVAGVTSARRTLRILPVYPASAKAGLTSWEIGEFVTEALERAGEFADPLPVEWRDRIDLWDRTDAFRAIHGPESLDVVVPARRRLVFDELFRLQLALVLRRRAFEVNARALHHNVSPREVTGGVSDTLVARFLAGLPYELTKAQRRALAVIVADMAGPFPMHRLLQGDVGSGKTVVALAALLAAVQSGHQGALMVPTEVLAEQHFAAVRALLGDLEGPGGMGGGEVRVELLTSRVKGKARAGGARGPGLGRGRRRRRDARPVDRGGGLRLPRRGGDRRATPLRGGAAGHVAGQGHRRRPGPARHDGDAHSAHRRHGDLRRPRPDHPRRNATRPPARHDRVAPRRCARRGPARLGPRARGGGGGSPGLRGVPAGQRLTAGGGQVRQRGVRAADGGELAGLPVGLMHGQMAAAAREEVMDRFRAGELSVLVATTVIEVGVDVPEATVMVVESADRFGIAQLHQLRGRVGRGGTASWCYLLGGEEGNERLTAVAGSTDGFALAEADLRVRGEGTLLGARQKGQSDLRLASLTDAGDMALLEEARQVAETMVDVDPQLQAHADLADEVGLLLSEDEEEYLFKS